MPGADREFRDVCIPKKGFPMFVRRLSMAALLAAGLLAAPFASAETMAYPSRDAANFLIDYPPTWEMTPGETAGDYTTLLGTSGTTLMLRTVAGEDAQDAVKSSIEYVFENYADVNLSEPKESNHRGLKGLAISGTATDSEIGKVKIGMGFYKLDENTMGEIWFAAPHDDEEGIAEAVAILDSFRAPE